MVKPHTRTLRDGSIKHMGFSFRGERDFERAGYRVRISVPGRDHFILNEFDIGVSDEEWTVGQKTMSAKQTADMLHKWMDDGVRTKYKE
jgi:hypothetical protein